MYMYVVSLFFTLYKYIICNRWQMADSGEYESHIYDIYVGCICMYAYV